MLLIHGVVVRGYLFLHTTCRKAHFLSIAISHQRKNSKYVELAEMKNNTKLFFSKQNNGLSYYNKDDETAMFFMELINQKILPSLEETEKLRFARHSVVLISKF